MRPSLLVSLVFAAVSSQPIAAFADEPDCSSNAWFCSTDAAVPAEPEPEPSADPSPAVRSESPPPTVVIIIVPDSSPATSTDTSTDAQPAPVTPPVTRPPPHRVIHKATPPKTITPAQPTAKRNNRNGGFDFYVQHLSFLGSQTIGTIAPDASLVGGGGMVRVFPRRTLEVQFGNSGIFGKDLNGFDRSEIGFTFHLARHFNPESRLRFSSIAGTTLSYGYITSDKPSPLLPKVSDDGAFYASYGVLAGQAGLSAELRLIPRMSVHFDILASLRWRFASTKDAPEYFDRTTGNATYAYPGVLLRGGVTIW